MRKIFYNIINTIFGISMDELYGSEDKPKKSIKYVGIFFFIIFITLLIVFFLCDNLEMSLKICLGYITFTSFALSFFTLITYFFEKKRNKDKFEKLKKRLFILAIILLLVDILPITFLSAASVKIKFNNFLKHMDKYFISFLLPLLISLLIVPYILFHCNFLSTLNLNYTTLLALLIFITDQFVTSLFLYAFHKIGKYKLNDIEYKSIKKDFNVIVFAEITTLTIITNCFVFSDQEQELLKGFTSAFAIYIAWDRLRGKWESLNQKFEQDSKQVNP